MISRYIQSPLFVFLPEATLPLHTYTPHTNPADTPIVLDRSLITGFKASLNIPLQSGMVPVRVVVEQAA